MTVDVGPGREGDVVPDELVAVPAFRIRQPVTAAIAVGYIDPTLGIGIVGDLIPGNGTELLTP